MTNKITARARFETLLTLSEVQAIDGMTAFIQNEIDKLDRKKAAGRSNPNAEAYEKLSKAIVDYMVPGTDYRVSDLMAAVAVPEGLIASTSLFSARMGDLVKAGTVAKEIVKGVARFRLVG